ncbi:MAG: zinc-binding dehydrogenase [Mucilaginibacter sp.]|jgi:Zn-dependent alcohol dehydrogenase|nr:zinc-binding dehydrogenase [Mucilaginibacter sp.]
MFCKAAITDGKGNFEIAEIDVNEPRDDQVLIKIKAAAMPQLDAAPLAMVGTAAPVNGIEQEITIDMNLFEWDKTYINPLYGKCRPQIDFPNIINFYEDGQLLSEEMITRTFL